jgi:hypothetical protein
VDTCQTDWTCTPCETHEDRFRLIVKRMADRHALGGQRGCGALQELVPEPPSPLFDRRAIRSCDGGNIRRIDNERKGQPSRQLPNECFVFVRCSPSQPMVEVGDPRNDKLFLPLKLEQQIQ